MEPLYPPDTLTWIKAYHAPNYVWELVQPVVYFLLLACLIAWATAPLYAWAGRAAHAVAKIWVPIAPLPVLRALPAALSALWSGSGWGQALLFSLSFQVIIQLAFWPAVLYFGYFHERAFGMWHATFGRFLYESAKSHLVSTLTLGSLTFGLFGLARKLRHWWWVLGIAASLALLGSAALDPYRSRLHYGQTPLEQGHLRTRLEKLLARAQVPFSDLVVMKTSDVSKNVDAYFAGQGPTRTIVLHDTLVKQFADDEIEAVVAHEAGHVHQVRWPGRLASSLSLFLFLWLANGLILRIGRWRGYQPAADVRTLPWLLGLFSLVTTLSGPVTGFFSRERERDADRFAIRLTDSPAAFVRMLRKAAQINQLDPDPPAFDTWIGSSHPPIQERIEEAMKILPKNNEAVGGPP